MRLTVLRNDAMVPPGHLARVAAERGVHIDLVALDAGDPLPDVESVEAVAVLGGEMGAYDVERYPYLAREKQFLREAVDAGVPVLGLCLGCQLLADALGGEAFLAPRPEVVLAPVRAVVDDPVVGVIAERPALAMHRDTWTVPEGGTLIAVSDTYNQAFRFGTALGVQPHPEVESEVLADWLDHPESALLVEQAGADVDAVRSDFDTAGDELVAAADAFFDAWLSEAKEILSVR